MYPIKLNRGFYQASRVGKCLPLPLPRQSVLKHLQHRNCSSVIAKKVIIWASLLPPAYILLPSTTDQQKDTMEYYKNYTFGEHLLLGCFSSDTPFQPKCLLPDFWRLVGKELTNSKEERSMKKTTIFSWGNWLGNLTWGISLFCSSLECALRTTEHYNSSSPKLTGGRS